MLDWSEPRAARGLQRDLFLRRKAVLLASDLAVVFGAGLVQLEASVSRTLGQASLVTAAFTLGHRRKAARDPHILMQHSDGVDPRDRRADRKTHRVAQRILDSRRLLLDQAAIAAEALH